MLTVDITLDARPYDQYTSSRNATVKGNLHDVIAHVCSVVNVDNIDIDHSAQLAYINAHTEKSASATISLLYNHTDTASRLKRVKTNLDLSPISAPQQHVPTESEIAIQQDKCSQANTSECYGPDYGCDPDYCTVHGA